MWQILIKQTMIVKLKFYKSLLICLWFISLTIILLLNYVFLKDSLPWPSIDSKWYFKGPWCEESRYRYLLREPSNSLSDFSFIATSFVMSYLSYKDYL